MTCSGDSLPITRASGCLGRRRLGYSGAVRGYLRRRRIRAGVLGPRAGRIGLRWRRYSRSGAARWGRAGSVLKTIASARVTVPHRFPADGGTP